MSKLKDHLACTGILLGLSLGQICLAQNVSFPEDVTIRRKSNPVPSLPLNPVASPNIATPNVATTNISQYVVYVPDPANLPKVKTVVPDAFVSNLDSGQRVVQIGRFNNLDLAQKRVDELKRSGLDAQLQTARVAQIPVQVPSNPPIPTTPKTIPIAPAVGLPDVPSVPVTPVTNSARVLTIPPVVTPLPAPPSVTENSTPKENSGNRFFVIIPSTEDSVLGKARAIVPSARLTSTTRGTYIEVQGYPDRSSAETLNVTMRSQGLDTRVIFF
jgi:hypothetical protein